MSKILLIDANSIFYACQHATKLHSGGMETQAVFGSVKTAKELRKLYPQFTQLWCHDTRATWRYALHPGYKSKRADTTDKVAVKVALETQRPYIKQAFAALGLRQMTIDGFEADDIIGHLSKKFSADPENQIGIISGDRDLCQLVKTNVWWRDMRDDSRLLTKSNFVDKTGCRTPFSFLETKVLQGDTSDCIEGVGGIGEKGAPEFIAEFGSVGEFWRRCDSGEMIPKKKAHVNLASGPGREIYKRNFQLMQLLKVNPPSRENTHLDVGKFDKESFANICGELSFISILKNLDEFTNFFL